MNRLFASVTVKLLPFPFVTFYFLLSYTYEYQCHLQAVDDWGWTRPSG